MSDEHSWMEKQQQQLPMTNDGWNDAAKEAAERALRGASAIRTTALEWKASPPRRQGASAALSAQRRMVTCKTTMATRPKGPPR